MPRTGHEPSSGLYWEEHGDPGAGPPLLLIPGGGATGACWTSTPDGRPGWAQGLLARGHRLWLTDWPGVGRSGGRNLLEIVYADVVDGYQRLLSDVIAEPVVVLCHSMGGAIAWLLVASRSSLVAGVVSVAGAYPGNLAARSELLAERDGVYEVRFADTGVEFSVDTGAPYLYEDAYIRDQAIADSTRFPVDRVAAFRAGLVPLPPRMVLQRLGVLEGMPLVDDPSGFEGTRVRLIAGDRDPAHTRSIEDRTVGQLREWGADAELIWLPSRGIVGNGHFLFLELNSEDVLELALGAIAEVGGA
jgi:pimeloyl-ACP methyl ester carboxylesterase